MAKNQKRASSGGKSKTRMLLVEPTVEQEQFAISSCSRREQQLSARRDTQIGQQEARSPASAKFRSLRGNNETFAKSTATMRSARPNCNQDESQSSRAGCSAGASNSSGGGSSSNKTELTSLLMILFGPLLLLFVLSACCSSPFIKLVQCQAELPASPLKAATSINVTATSSWGDNATSASSPALDLETGEEPAEASAAVAAEPLGPDEDAEEPIGRTDDHRLPGVVLEAASEAADQLVGRLRSGDDSASEMDQEEAVSLASAAGEPAKNGSVAARQYDADLKLAMETYAKWRSAGDDVIELFSRKMLPIIVEHGYDVDPGTVTGLLQVFNGIRSLKGWALKLLDASAKLSPGILVGTQSDFGDFDECLSIRVDDPSGLVADNSELAGELDPLTGLRSSTLVGRYCLADVEFPKPPRRRLAERNLELQSDLAPIELRRPLLNFSETAQFKDTIFVETGNFFHMLYVDPMRVGICLTNKIDPENFSKVFNKIFQHLKVAINFHGRCVTRYDKPIWSSYQKISAYIIVAACSLVALCTLLDVLHSKFNKLPLPTAWTCESSNLGASLARYRPLFTSFSLIRNTKRLFKSQQHQQAAGDASKLTAARQLHLDLNLVADGSPLASIVADSSVESSPSIERRSSVAGSAANLILASNSQMDHIESNHRRGHRKDIGQVNLQCLHGIRVITMTWMIINHTYLFGGFFVLWAHRRLIDIAEWPKSLSFQLVLNGWLTVETYFFLSAAIIVMNVMPLMKSAKFAYLTYILHRLLRLLPAYVGLVCLNFLWPLISSGPVWLVKGRSFIQTPCENYLWTNFLFINNWIWPEKQCMVHTWFLSADFQLYLLAPLIIYLLHRRPVLGHSMTLIVAIVGAIISGLVIYANKLMPATLINKLEFDSIKQQLSYSYFATYQHMGPYCLGIFVGYMLHKRPQVKLPKHLTWALWILLPPLSFTTLLLTYLWNGAYDDPSLINPSPLVSALYVAIHRTVWSSLLAWIVFACATGRAKLMSSFLAHHTFIPLSRLSFSIYLVHLPVIMFRALNLRHTIEWTDSNIFWEACGNFVVSVVMGYFLNVAFETPIINLERIVFGRPGERPPSSPPSDQLKQNLRSQNVDNLRPSMKSLDSNDSDGDHSEQLAASSPEQERKSSTDDSSHEWPTDQRNRKSLRPKQKPSVERIFGELEPAKVVESSADPMRYRDVYQGLYDVGSEYQHYARGGYHQWRMDGTRAVQYATLARTTGSDHNQARSGQRSLFAPDRGQFAGGRSRPVALANQRQSQRRQARYNTLTGIGSREWGGQGATSEPNEAVNNWRMAPQLMGHQRRGSQCAMDAASWIGQPGGGLMIPRIDSSTLRRRSEITAATSGGIAEEESNVEAQENSAL